jgi:hypothetical protein
MLLKNLNLKTGLVNGTRLIVKKCLKSIIQCEILNGPTAGCITTIYPI